LNFIFSTTVISSLFDDHDGDLKMFLYLLQFGAIEVLNGESRSSDNFDSSQTLVRQQPTEGLSLPPLSKLTPVQVSQLTKLRFLGINIVGWIVRFGHMKGLQNFLQKGYDPTQPVDSDGNPLLHFIALHSSGVEMVNTVMAEKLARIEQCNSFGETAGMTAARVGNLAVGKELFNLGACARTSLCGKYSAWILAFARKKEKREKNNQSGVVGDDDEMYYNISPDPFYSLWMKLK
jgi:ankyrin repeat protein